MNRRLVAVVAVAAAVAVAAIAWVVFSAVSNRTTAVDVDELASDLAGSSTTATPTSPPAGAAARATATTSAPTTTAPPAAPEAGVYRYATEGDEALDVLTGVQRTYPAETPVVVTPTPCGFTVLWKPYVERELEMELCRGADGELELVRTRNLYEFFAQRNERVVACPAGTAIARAVARCEGSGLVEDRTAALVGDTTVDVAGRAVPAVEVRVSVTTSGDTTGTIAETLWLDPATGLPLRWERAVENATETVAGTARYRERVVLTLSSLQPV